MKNHIFLLVLTLAGCSLLPAVSDAQNRQYLSMDLNWKFARGDHQQAKSPGFDDGGWRELDLPHDWSIEGEFTRDAPTGGSGGYLPTGMGWYRKTFNVPESMLDKSVWIQFDGIYMNSNVWINGHHLGHRPYGYISFKYDLTGHLEEGENVIAVRVDNSKQPSSRWYSGSGIYRHTWLTVTDPLHVEHWGVYATTPVATEDSAVVRVETKVMNERDTEQNGDLVSVLVAPDGNEVARGSISFSAAEGAVETLNQELKIEDPGLWSVDSPSLYQLQSIIRQGENQVDETTTTIGIRNIEYKTDKGFFLNGEHIKMHGVNLHHGGGPVGAAVPIGVWERRFKKLKEMGVNAIRTAHNPMSPEFMDLCDRMGFLVMNEVFDEWTYGKRDYTYHLYFDKWWEKDLKAFIKRDRNHPSVVMWSAGNEIGEQMPETGVGVLEQLMGVFHELDPSRPVTTGNDHIGDVIAPATKKFLEALDIVGYNYADRWLERRELYWTKDKLEYPHWKMLGTESSNIYGVRGNYSLGDSTIVLPNYDSNMIRAEELWKYVAMHDFVIGDFMWTGIDYLGEAWWPAKHASSGSLDLSGFEKDSYYFYKSQWSDEPVLHLFPHWNWSGREGQYLPVLAYTNIDTVDLYLNDQHIGQRRIEFPRQGTSCGWNCYEEPRVNPTTAGLHARWDVQYEPGTLKAVGREDGEVVMTKEITTTGDPASIRLSVDKESLVANGRDVAHLKVEIVDENSNIVPMANNLVEFDISGEGKIIGVGNGNPTDNTSHKDVGQRKAFNGLALAIIQSNRETGSINVNVTSENLTAGSVELRVEENQNGKYFYEDIQE